MKPERDSHVHPAAPSGQAPSATSRGEIVGDGDSAPTLPEAPLVDFLEELRASAPGVTVEPNSQHWQGMDGAVAWHLIDRHADNWADIGFMMNEWLEANAQRPHQPQGAASPQGADEQREHAWNEAGRRIQAEDMGLPYRPRPAPSLCWCADCNPGVIQMFVCPACGCKRCPRAGSHEAACTGRTGPDVPGGHTCSGCVENRARLDAAVRAASAVMVNGLTEAETSATASVMGLTSGGSSPMDTVQATGRNLTSEARPEGALASNGHDGLTPEISALLQQAAEALEDISTWFGVIEERGSEADTFKARKALAALRKAIRSSAEGETGK